MKPAKMSFTHFLGVFHLSIAFLVLYLLKVGQSSVEVARPRGVTISRIGLYDPEHDFTCFDGSRTIPFNQVKCVDKYFRILLNDTAFTIILPRVNST